MFESKNYRIRQMKCVRHIVNSHGFFISFNCFMVVFLLLSLPSSLLAQNIYTIAGGSAGDNGDPLKANLEPTGLAFDPQGNLYFGHFGNSRIRKLDFEKNTITSVVGNGDLSISGDDGPAIEASIRRPLNIAIDPDGFLFFSDLGSNQVRIVDPNTHIISTFAGNGKAEDEDSRFAKKVALLEPRGLAIDSLGNVYIAEGGGHRIHKVNRKDGTIQIIAGNGEEAYNGDRKDARLAALDFPTCLVLDEEEKFLYFSDSQNRRVRRIELETGALKTIAGNGRASFNGDDTLVATDAHLNLPVSLIQKDSILYICDQGQQRIRMVNLNTQIIGTFAGNGRRGFNEDGLLAHETRFNFSTRIVAPPGQDQPSVMIMDEEGNIFISDTRNYRIRRIDHKTKRVSTIAGNGTLAFSGEDVVATDANFFLPSGLCVDSACNIYIADTKNHRIRRIDAQTNRIYTLAGNGEQAFSGDQDSAILAALDTPRSLVRDSLGNIYIADSGNNRIRMIDAQTGLIQTIAGNGQAEFSGDNGLAQNAGLNNPSDIVLDNFNNLYIADANNHRIRKIDLSSGQITTVAGNGLPGYNGDNQSANAAQLNRPSGIVLDQKGNLFIADAANHRIRKVDLSNQIITSIAGTGTSGYGGDGGDARQALFNIPARIAIDAMDNLYIADSLSFRIRKINPNTGIIETIAGNGIRGLSGDNAPATLARLDSPLGLTLDKLGNLYISVSNRIRLVTAPFQPKINGNLEVCSDDIETYSASTPTDSKFTYQWAVEGGEIIQGNHSASIQVRWLQMGSGKIRLLQRNNYGETQSTDLDINIQDAVPSIRIQSLSEEKIICPGTKLTLVPVEETPEYQYEWFKEGKITPIGSDKNLIVNEPGQYWLRIQNNCQIIESDPFEVLANEVFIPTLFSPNRDGKNDVLRVRSNNISGMSALRFQVFDRQGNLVYKTEEIPEATEEGKGWDGGNYPSGIYIWTLEVQFNNCTTFSEQGKVTLVK